MLIARGSTELGRASVRWAFALTKRVWCLVVDRHDLVLDTRFVPPSTGPAKDRSCVYLLVRGSWQEHGGAAFEGPAAFVLTPEQLEGANGVRRSTFRSVGDPYQAIEVHVEAADCLMPPSTRLELDESTWNAAARLAHIGEHTDDSLERAARELVRCLAAQRVLRAEAAEAALREDSWALRRLWRAIEPIVRSFSPSSSLKEVSDATGISVRQATRLLESVLSFSVWGSGWRELTLHARLKLAVLLLSAEGVATSDVARIVGYGSINAMARAFRAARMDAPHVVQRRVRESASGSPDERS